jgi:DNA-binding protein H-NS
MTLDISDLTKKELIALRRKVDSAIEKWDAEKLSKARREAKQLANSYGLKLEDLLGETPSQASKKPAPKPKKRRAPRSPRSTEIPRMRERLGRGAGGSPSGSPRAWPPGSHSRTWPYKTHFLLEILRGLTLTLRGQLLPSLGVDLMKEIATH